MTVIAAALTGVDRITLAADSEVTGGWQKSEIGRPKLWADGEYAFGTAGSVRAAQVIRHHVIWPSWEELDYENFDEFCILEVVPAIRAGVKGHGVLEKYRDGISLPVELMIATKGELALICSDFGVHTETTPRLATGSGYAEALGSLGDRGPWRPKDVVRAARRASLSAVGVGGAIVKLDTRELEVRPA